MAVAAVAVAVAVPAARHRDGGAAQPPVACEPSGVTRPAASTEAEEAAGRLVAVQEGKLTPALAGPLRQALPGATLLDAFTCEQGFSFHADLGVAVRTDSTPGRFTVGIVAVDGAGVARLDGWVTRAPAPAGRGCAGADDGATCVREERQDGTVVYRARADRGGGAVLLTVDTYRPDGGHVHLEVRNFVAAGDAVTVTRPVPPLDEAALTALTLAEHLAP